MKSKLLFLILLGLIQLLGQTTSDTTVLDSVVIFDYSADVQTPISYQDLGRKWILQKTVGQEPSFVLSQTPSVTAYSDAGSTQGYAYFRLRGIDQTRINMTLDGVPLNEPEDQGAYFSNYPDFLNSVSKIQIQRGVGTSQNGVASYAGSMQFSSPQLLDSAKLRVGASYGSYNSYRLFGEYTTGLRKKKAMYVRLSQLHSDGYKYHSGNSSQSVFWSGGLYLSKSIWKLLGFSGWQRNELAWLGVSSDSIAKDRRSNANTGEKDQFMQHMVQLQNHWFLSSRSTIKSTLYYNHLKGNYDFDYNNFASLPPNDDLYNYAFLSHLVGFFSTYNYETSRIKLTGGLHANHYTRSHIGSLNTFGELYRNKGFKREASTFAKLSYEVVPRLIYLVDLQLRHSTFDYKGGVPFKNQAWTFFNPKTGLSYKVNRGLNVYYSIGQTQREPTRTDMFGGNDDLLADSTGASVLYINAPERVLDQELGIRMNKAKYHINANVYWMDFKNEIVLNGKFGANGLALNSNVSKSYRMGVEVDGHVQLHKAVKYLLNASYNYSEIQNQGLAFKPILTPKLILNHEIELMIQGWCATLELRYQGASFIDFSNEHQINGYVLVNTKLGYQYKHWGFTGRVNNVLNTKYYNNGYVDTAPKYFVQAPINYSLSVEFNY